MKNLKFDIKKYQVSYYRYCSNIPNCYIIDVKFEALCFIIYKRKEKI